MGMSTKPQLGFTLVELVVGVGIMMVLVGLSVAGFQAYARYQQYQQAVGNVLATLNDARVQARAAESGQAHGVKLFTSNVVTFLGSTYTSSSLTNRTYTFDNVRIIPELTGGATQVVFEALTGRPMVTGTISVVGTQHLATTTITITGSGVIQ